MEVEIDGYPGLMASMPGLSGKDQVLMRTLILKSKEDSSCGTATRLNSGLRMYTHMYVYPHMYVHIHANKYTCT